MYQESKPLLATQDSNVGGVGAQVLVSSEHRLLNTHQQHLLLEMCLHVHIVQSNVTRPCLFVKHVPVRNLVVV